MGIIKRRCKIYTSKIKWQEEVETLKQMGAKGAKLKDIAAKYLVSKQRVQQVISRYIPEWEDTYGGVARRRKKAEEWYKKWGEKTGTALYKAQRHKFYRKKANATKVGYTWDIEFSDVVFPAYCPVLGLELDYFAETRQENSPSFDRVDNNKGYEKGNVIIVSWRANRIKNDGTPAEHRAIADYLENTQY